MSADPEGLAAFDTYFALDRGVCSRPAGWEALPFDLFFEMIDAQVDEGASCLHDLSCGPTADCRNRILKGGNGASPRFPRGTCTALLDEGDSCVGSSSCLPDLLCRFDDTVGANRCQPPAEEGRPCQRDDDCLPGHLCFPPNLEDVILDSVKTEEAPAVCHDPNAVDYPFRNR